MRILLAEHDTHARQTIASFLLAAGHEVTAVGDAASAWSTLEQLDPPRYLVLDWAMPGLRGAQFIQKAGTILHTVPIVLADPSTEDRDLWNALETSAADCLTKPFKPHQLRARLSFISRLAGLEKRLLEQETELRAVTNAHRETEAALAQEQYCLNSLMNNLPLAIYFKDRAGRFTRVNHEQARRLGLPDPPAAVGFTESDFYGMDHTAESRADEERILLTGEALVEKETEETWPDGRVNWFASTRMPLRAATGEIIGTFGISRDITSRRQSEEASRFLASIVQASDDAIAGIELDGTIASWNWGAENLYGYTASEVIGRSIALLVPVSRRDELTQILEELAQGERIMHFETEHRINTGKKVDVALTISPIKSASGKPIRGAVVARDITTRRKAEDELYQSRQRLQLILDSIPQRVFWKDRNLKFLGCNKTFALDAGVQSASEIVGKDDFELSWAATAEDYRRDDRLVMAQELPKLNFDEKRINPDGSPMWLRTSKLPLRDRSGNVVGVLGTYEDITERKLADEALQASENRYRLLFERNLAGVFRTSLAGLVIDSNHSAAQLLGFNSADELPGVDVRTIYYDPLERASFLEKIQKHGAVSNYELKFRRRDGIPIWVVANVSLVVPPDGGEPFLEGTIVDITGRKRAEDALAEEARLAALRAEVASALIKSRTLREGLKECTDALVARTGAAFARIWTLDQPSSTLLLEASSGIYTHTDGPHRSVPFGEFKIGRIAQRRQRHLSNDVQNDPEIGDREWAKRTGMVSFVGHPLIAGDIVMGVVAAFGRSPFTDATLSAFASVGDQIAQFVQGKRAEIALLRSEERARLLFATIPHPAYVFDLETLEFKEVNEVAVRHYGYTREEFLRMRTCDIHVGQDSGSTGASHEGPKPGALNDQLQHRTSDGTVIDVEINSQLLDYDGRRAVLVVAQDVTERNRLELDLRHAQKLEAVGGLASGIAHEINTPIQFVGDNIHFLHQAFGTLDGLVGELLKLKAAVEGRYPEAISPETDQLIDESDLEFLLEEIPKALTQSVDGVGRVASIVKAMKDFAHSEQCDRAAADLNKALASTLIVARNEIKYVADVTTDFGELPHIECSVGDLNQVFLNILVNAAHAIEDSMASTGERGRISITTRHEGGNVVISIGDTGVGIPEAARGKVFEPFFTTKRVGRGTGQGLAISRSIVVDKHGGTLTFESEVGRGTTFKITLPASHVTRPVEEGLLM